MICPNCQVEAQDARFCPHCGYRLDDEADYPPQDRQPQDRPGDRYRRGRVFRRWIWPSLILVVVIAFGILAMGLMGFRDGSAERERANRQQAEIHYNRGLIYLEWGQFQLAEAEFEEAVRLVPGYEDAESSRRLAQVKQTVTPSPTPIPSATPTQTPVAPTSTPEVVEIPLAQALFESSVADYEKGNWEQAISKLEQLRSEDVTYRPDQVLDMLVQSHRNYGLELEAQDLLEEAISHYDSALYLRRRDPELEERRRRADLYIKALGAWKVDWETVIVNLTALHALAPDYKDTAERLYTASTTYGQALIKRERYCAAAELFELALNIHDDPEIVQLEDDARHICEVSALAPLETPMPDGTTPGLVHLGTLLASCYDHRTDQYSLCAQDAESNELYTWLSYAEQPALTLDGTMLAYRSSDPERPGLYAVSLAIATEVTDTVAAAEMTGTVTGEAITGTMTGEAITGMMTGEAITGTIAAIVVSPGPAITITTEADVHYPTWSPDGTRIAYAQYDAEQEDWFIYIALADGSAPPRRIHQGEWPAWGPNGLLAFTTCSGEELCGIHLFDPATWDLRILTGSIQDRASGWSPSGDELAYMSDVGRSFNLYIVHAGSSHVRQITRNLFTDVMPVWSPDGQRIAYVTNRDDDWALYVMHPYGDQQERIAGLGAQSADEQRFRLNWVAPVLRFPNAP
jgi:tetratricopeptide (TPR) repeat protein